MIFRKHAVLLLSTLSALILGAVFFASAADVVVEPSNPDWIRNDPSNVIFSTEMPDPNGGAASLRFSNIDTAKHVSSPSFLPVGTLLSDITNISYDAAIPATQTPQAYMLAVFISVALNDGTGRTTWLIYEPVYTPSIGNPPLTPGVWRHISITASTEGWWSTAKVNPDIMGSGQCDDGRHVSFNVCSLTEFITDFPLATVAAPMRLQGGGGWTITDVHYGDNFSVTYAGITNSVDFELVVPTPTPTETVPVTPGITPTAPVILPTLEPTFPPPPACEEEINDPETSMLFFQLTDANGDPIRCQIFVRNGAYLRYRGQQLTSLANIGIEGVDDLGIIQAVDLFSPVGKTSFAGGIVACLRGEGSMLYLGANDAPRHIEIVGTYTIPEFPNFTCLTIFEPVSLVLVRNTPN